ncbi:MAG: hypothetical protein JXN59_04945 [Anaerolineae bacterium]|nr:hypothetical protein [Anaerolineae bacterium]
MQSNHRPGPGRAFRLAVGTLLIPLIIYAAGAIHIRYMADDYCTIADAREFGVLGNVAHVYQSWAGSFSTIGIMSAAALIGPAAEPLILLGALVAWWLLLADLFGRAARWRGLSHAPWLGAAAASIFCLTTISGAPHVYQSVYWMNGRTAYFLPLVLITLVAWLLVQAQARDRVRPALLLLIGGLAFVLGGFAISYSLATVCLLGLAFVIWRGERPVNRYLAFALGMAVIGLAVFMLAPGNSARQSQFPPPDLLFTIGATLTSPAWPGMMSFYMSPFAALAALLFPLGVARYHDTGTLAHPARAMLLIPGVLAVLVGVCYAPAFYAMSASLPGRVWILPQFMTLAGLMLWGYVVGLATRKNGLRPLPGWVRAGAWLLLAAVLISTTLHALEVNRELGRYAAAWDARDRQLRAVEDPTEPVRVVAFGYIFRLEDVLLDGNGWVDDCIAEYYGLDSIIGVAE